jgi:Methylase involved in ubiquinone/menaquinone biosynthesis
MQNYCQQNKEAWEFNAYDFWVSNLGKPSDRAKLDLENPKKMLKRYTQYFDSFTGIKVANICGSCGKKAIPLAILGSDVTIFDISENNKKYAFEVANAAKVNIDFVVGDVLEINMNKYEKYFDVIFMEGGILHYFHDINQFMKVMCHLLKPNGRMICSDFHPFQKISDMLELEQPTMSYFSTDIFEGEMAHARFFPDEIRKQMPLCSYRKYTVSEIINAVIENGFVLNRFDEHPAWNNENVPGEFTIIAYPAENSRC